MKRLLLALALLPVVANAAETPMAVAKKSAADYRNAFLKKDFSFLETGSTADFVYIDSKGVKTPKAQVIAGMKATMKSMKLKAIKVDVLSAKMAEGGVIYVQQDKVEATMSMGGPKTSVMKSDSREEVLMVKKNGVWLTKRVKSIYSKDTLDGKPMKM